MYKYTLSPGQKLISSFSGEYYFLSNFYTTNIQLDFNGVKIDFPSVEHAFQACKTLNTEEAIKISREPTPGKAKQAGGRRGYITLRSDWEQIKYDVMYNLLKLKFFGDEALRAKLLATGDAILIEGNTWRDTCWGMYGGKGENNLGILLMKVRGELQSTYTKEYHRDRCYECLLRCKFCEYQLTCTMKGNPDRMHECLDHCCHMSIEECDSILNSIKRD